MDELISTCKDRFEKEFGRDGKSLIAVSAPG